MMSPLLALLVVYGGLAVIGGLFHWREHVSSGRPGRPPLQGAQRIDFAYWLFTPLVSGPLTRVATYLVLVGAGTALGAATTLDGALEAIGSTPWAVGGRLPLGGQLLLALVWGDLVGYWSHRLRHRVSVLWNHHAIHHSPQGLRWFHGARMHPFDDVVDNVLVGAALLASGVGPVAFALHGPLLLLHTIYLHADVPWSLGPLRHVLVSPQYHRHHHHLSSQGEGHNFAGMFAVYDRLFGTQRDPGAQGDRVEAIRCGVDDWAIPSTLGGQLLAPLLKTHRDALARLQRTARR